MDNTPKSDSEFQQAGDPLTLPSPLRGRGDVGGRMDLLTILEHEVGHFLGYDHTKAGKMADILFTGVRRSPTVAVNPIIIHK